MFSSEGILKEIVREKQEETNSAFAFMGCYDAVTNLPKASKTNKGNICIVHNKNKYDMYVCNGLDWQIVATTNI